MTLDELENRIASRAAASPDESYTAKLIGRGIEKCAQKLGEEATEVVIAAVTGNRSELVKEGHASAVLAASVFHFGTFTIPQAKQYLRDHGVAVRMDGAA